jgi:transcriptional regulator with XRE-family HTH domain
MVGRWQPATVAQGNHAQVIIVSSAALAKMTNLDEAARFLGVLGTALFEMRKRSGLTQEKLASLAGFSRTTVYKVEKTGQDMTYLNVRNWLAASGGDWRAFGEELQRRDLLPSKAVVNNGSEMIFARTLEPLEALGATVRTYRRTTGLSQEAFAYRCGRARNHVMAIERAHCSPRFSTLRSIVDKSPVNWRDFFHSVHRLDPVVRRLA